MCNKIHLIMLFDIVCGNEMHMALGIYRVHLIVAYLSEGLFLPIVSSHPYNIP